MQQPFIKSVGRAHFEELKEFSPAVQNMLGPILGAVSSLGRSCLISGPCMEKLFACTSGKVDQEDLGCSLA